MISRLTLACFLVSMLAILNTHSASAGPVPEDCQLIVDGLPVSGDFAQVNPGSIVNLSCPNVLISGNLGGTLSTEIQSGDPASKSLWGIRRHGNDDATPRVRQSFTLQAGNYDVTLAGVVPSTIKVENGEIKDKPVPIDIIKLEIQGQGIVNPRLTTTATSKEYMEAQTMLGKLTANIDKDPDLGQRVAPMVVRVEALMEIGRPVDAAILMQIIAGFYEDTLELKNEVQRLESDLQSNQQTYEEQLQSEKEILQRQVDLWRLFSLIFLIGALVLGGFLFVVSYRGLRSFFGTPPIQTDN